MRVIGSSIPNVIRQNNATMIKTLREIKKSHPKCVSLGYLNINSIRNKFSDRRNDETLKIRRFC